MNSLVFPFRRRSSAFPCRHGSPATRLSLFLLAVLFFQTAGTAISATPKPISLPIPSGLAPVQFLPDGVSIESGLDALSIRVTLPAESPSKPLEMYVIAPASVPLMPTLTSEKEGGIPPEFEAASLAQIQEEGVVRFWRLIKVTIDLSQDKTSLLNILPGESFVVRFPFQKTLERPAALEEYTRETWGFGKLLRHLVANPEALPLYANRGQSAAHTPPAARPWSPLSEGHAKNWFRILVSQDGLIRITRRHLEMAGMNPDMIPPDSVRVFSRGKPVPSFVLGGESETFTSEHAIVFYALESESQYARERAYWISAGEPGAAARMPVRKSPGPMPARHIGVTATMEEMRVEKDEELLIQHGNFLAIKDYAWVWKAIHAKEPTAFPFDLPFRDPRTTETVEMEIRFYFDGQPAPPPPGNAVSLLFQINDSPPITESFFASSSDNTRKIQVEPKYLKEESNTLLVRIQDSAGTLQPDGDIYVDYFTIRYRRTLVPKDGRLAVHSRGDNPWYLTFGFHSPFPLVFDLTHPESPELIETQALGVPRHCFFEDRPERRLLAIEPFAIPDAPDPIPAQQTNLADASNAADYLLIYHRHFEKQIQPLLSLQRERGFLVRAVEISEVYQEYSMGECTPHAVKDFLYDALRRWKTPPTYVCLFGDATSDYRDNLRAGLENFVPAYSVTASDKEVWASELWFATLIGRDLFPDVILGRISARYPEDAEEMVRKVVEYQNAAPLGPWRGRFAYCADDTGFRAATSRLHENYRSPMLSSERIYLEDFTFVDNFYLPKEVVKEKDLKVSTDATLKLLDTFNRGVSLMLFMGHGSPNIWTDERIWFGGDSENSDNANMRNAGRLPFVTTFTCNHGAFDYPMPKWHVCISEDMMRVKKGGAIALYVPSGPGFTQTHEKLANALFQALLREKVNRVGETVALCKLYYLLTGGNATASEMAQMYVLLGDPTIDLVIPDTWSAGTVSPAQVSLYDLPAERKMSFEGPAETAAEGRFVAALFDPDDQEVAMSEPLPYRDGKIQWEFEIPRNPRHGKWTVRVYYGNDDSRQDGLLLGFFEIIRPFLEIESFEVRRQPSKKGEEAELELVLRNASDVPIRQGGIGMTEFFSDQRTVRQFGLATPVNLTPRETRAFSLSRKIEDPLIVYQAAVPAEFALPPNDEHSSQKSDAIAVVHLGADAGTTSVLVQPLTAEFQARRYDPIAEGLVRIPLYYSGFSRPLLTEVRLLDARNDQIASTSALLGTDDFSQGITWIRLQIASDRQRLKSCRLVINAIPDGDTLLNTLFPIPDPQLPDLRIVPGSASFRPEKPVEGETIFMRFQIENAGPMEASPFHLKVVSKRPGEKEKPLEPRPYMSSMYQTVLGARQKRWVDIRWDYPAFPENAGLEVVELTIDSQDMVAELNEANNTSRHSHRIVTPARIRVFDHETTHRVLTLPDGKRKVAATAVVHNLGEKEDFGWHIGFYRKPPATLSDYLDPDFLAKDIPLGVVDALSSQTITQEWAIAPGETPAPVARVYKPVLSVRTSGQDAIEPEW